MADVPEADEPDDAPRPRGLVGDARARGERLAGRGQTWIDDRRRDVVPVDLAVVFYERDRDAFASVLGAAIALRLFLFFVPAMVLVTTIVMLVSGHDGVRELAQNAGVTGGLASQVDEATSTATSTTLGIFAAALWLTVWAGRSLTKVLAACSAGAWQMPGRAGKATLRMAAAVTTLVFLLVVTAGVLNRLKDTQGPAVVTTSWVVAAVVYAFAWFLVSATLPRRTSDPGALLPGAAMVGVALAGLQWFMQYYLPTKVSHSTALAGSVGAAVATLGYMFLIGRIMASSLILDAVVFDKVGSVSEVVFGLPGLRRLPRRSPRLARYFDLDRAEPVPSGAGDPLSFPGTNDRG